MTKPAASSRSLASRPKPSSAKMRVRSLFGRRQSGRSILDTSIGTAVIPPSGVLSRRGALGASFALFLGLGTAMVGAQTFNGTIQSTDPTQTGWLNRNGIRSTSSVPKANPGLASTTGSRFYNEFTFTNSYGITIDYQVNFSAPDGNNLFTAAYLGSFVPSNPSTNYLADPGDSSASSTYSFAVPAGDTFDLIVHAIDIVPGEKGDTYTLQLVQLTATQAFWTGNQSSVWSTNNAGKTNWATDGTGTTDLGGIPNTDVVFSANGAKNQNTTLGSDFTIHSLTVNDTTPVVISSGLGGTFTLTISGDAGTGITANNGANLTINSNVTLGGSSDTIATNGNAMVTINGVLAGSNGLIKNGTGTLTLIGNNTFTGGTTVNAGTLQVGDGTTTTSLTGTPGAAVVSGTGGTAVTVNNAATLAVMAAATVTGGNGKSLSGEASDAGGGGAAVSFVNGGTLTNSGSLVGGAGGTTAFTHGNSGAGGIGANFNSGGTFTNNGFVTGGSGGSATFSGHGGDGGAAVNMSGNGSFVNSDVITGGAGGSAHFTTGSAGAGGVGVVISNGGSVTNESTGLILGGKGGDSNNSIGNSGSGGAGVSFLGDGTLTNYGTIGDGPSGSLATTSTGTVGAPSSAVVFTGTGTFNNLGSGTIIGDVQMANAANSVTLETGSTINGSLNIGTDTGATLTLTGSGTATYSGSVLGTTTFAGSLVKNGTGTWTLDQAFTYSGNTTVQDGTLQLGAANVLPAGTTVTINQVDGSGNATFDLNGHSQTIAGLTFIAPETGSVVDLNGGVLTLKGDVNLVDNTTAPGNGGSSYIQDTAGGGALDLGGAVRTFNIAGQNVGNVDLTISAIIQNGGVIINAINSSTIGNSAGVDLTAANTYAGGTTINSGYLLANNTSGSATGTGAVIINSGGTLAGLGTVTGPVTLNSGGALEAGSNGVGPKTTRGTLHLGSVLWNGGGLVNLELGTTSDQLALTGALTKGTTGTYGINIFDGGGIANQKDYVLATFASTTFVGSDFTLSLPKGFTGSLLETPTELELVLSFAASGAVIQNSAPVNLPVITDFTVIGPVSTGGPKDNNTINSLIFTPGGTLTINNTLTLTSGNVTTGGGTNTITGGTLFGPNGLHFNVNGNLFIRSTLIGNASLIGGGSLFLDSVLYGNLNVLQGLLGGNGTIVGNLYNSSIVSPGHSPGQIHVTGNNVQSPSGLLQIQIGGRDITQHDLLSVDGTASLNGTLQLERLNGFKLKRHEPVTFLTANEGVIGRFARVENGFTSDTILAPTVVYQSNSVALAAVQGSFAALAGLTPNQKSVAQALDSINVNDHRANSLLDYLDYRKLNELPRDFDKIAPEELTSVFTIGVSLATVQSQNIQRRNDDIRSGSAGFNAAGLAVNSDGPSYSGSFFNQGVAGPSGDDGKMSKEVKQVAPEETRWGAFLSGTGQWVTVGNTDNARGYNLDSGGFTLGVDYKVTPNLAIGIAAGYTGTTADLNDGGRIYTNGGKFGLYATFFDYQRVKETPTMSKDSSKEAPAPATYQAPQGLYADVAVFGGYNSYDLHRSALQGESRGDTDGGELNVLFGTGYDFRKGHFTFGPTASFNYTYVGTNAFSEHGSLAPLNIHGGKGESLRTAFGIKASYDWKVGGVLIKPELRASWQHEYSDAAYALDSNFANGAGDTFRVNGPKLGRDSALLGAGFAIQLSERCSTYFYYDGELGRTNYHSASVTGGLRLAF